MEIEFENIITNGFVQYGYYVGGKHVLHKEDGPAYRAKLDDVWEEKYYLCGQQLVNLSTLLLYLRLGDEVLEDPSLLDKYSDYYSYSKYVVAMCHFSRIKSEGRNSLILNVRHEDPFVAYKCLEALKDD
jgi:hypothetical protein